MDLWGDKAGALPWGRTQFKVIAKAMEDSVKKGSGFS